MPVGEGVFYSMMSLDGKSVAAIAPQPQQQRDAGAPPSWQSYVTVEDADAVVERATELGGTAHAPAFDVMEAGRMAVLQDPHGAFFMIWQPKAAHRRLAGQRARRAQLERALLAGLRRRDGLLRRLFGWTFAPLEGSPEPYLVIQNGERGNGGIRTLTPPGVPPHWLVYFGVADLDASLAKLERARRQQGHRADRHPGRQDRDRARSPGRALRPLQRRVRSLIAGGPARAPGVGAGRRRHHRGGSASKRADARARARPRAAPRRAHTGRGT